MTAKLADQRAAAVEAAKKIVAEAKGAERELTDEERDQIDEHMESIKKFDVQIKDADRARSVLALASSETIPDDGQAKSLGDHFVKHAWTQMQQNRGIKGASVAAPEFSAKAASDPHLTGGTSGVFAPVITELDRFPFVTGVRRRLMVADLMGQGTVGPNTQAISYFVEGAIEGAPTAVTEGSAKPQIHFANPTLVTDALRKLAAWWNVSDEMIEDLDFVVSEINNRGVYELRLLEENQLLAGNGTAPNISGILDRTISTETSTSIDDNADAIFRGMTICQTDGGLDADGIVIHPTDYQALRLSKDANGQYFGGGFFTGPYGNGGVMEQPPVWGLRTVVTPAITAGTVLVGAFQQGATVYRKGGIRVESTNSHASNFVSNLVTFRVEERVGLAVRRPLAFCAVTLSDES